MVRRVDERLVTTAPAQCQCKNVHIAKILCRWLSSDAKTEHLCGLAEQCSHTPKRCSGRRTGADGTIGTRFGSSESVGSRFQSREIRFPEHPWACLMTTQSALKWESGRPVGNAGLTGPVVHGRITVPGDTEPGSGPYKTRPERVSAIESREEADRDGSAGGRTTIPRALTGAGQKSAGEKEPIARCQGASGETPRRFRQPSRRTTMITPKAAASPDRLSEWVVPQDRRSGTGRRNE